LRNKIKLNHDKSEEKFFASTNKPPRVQKYKNVLCAKVFVHKYFLKKFFLLRMDSQKNEKHSPSTFKIDSEPLFSCTLLKKIICMNSRFCFIFILF